MDIIKLTRELGVKIQEDEKYLKLKIAAQNNNEDTRLQELIGEFNLKRVNISNEASKKEHDDEKIKILNEELKACYEAIMTNENMIRYNNAKMEFDALIQQINAIIIGAANGEDPLTIDVMQSGCNGNCSDCSGCH